MSLRCNKCEIDKPLDEFYSSCKTRCRSCIRRAAKEYNARPEIAARRRSPEYKTYHDNYRAQYSERKRASQKKYQSKPEVKARRAGNQRARIRGIKNSLPLDAYVFIIATYGACLRCNSTNRLQVDHVVPLARGGEHSLRNLQVLCQTCNISKGARSNADYRDFVVIATPYEFGVS